MPSQIRGITGPTGKWYSDKTLGVGNSFSSKFSIAVMGNASDETVGSGDGGRGSPDREFPARDSVGVGCRPGGHYRSGLDSGYAAGLQKAQSDASAIIEEAKAQADRILASAEKQASKLTEPDQKQKKKVA